MKILFVRHGQSEDDILDAYGGWADFHLTEEGKKQVETTANKIAKLDINFEKILSSPLFRAQESAKIISEKLNIPVETFQYVKERNTYGILCGIKKDTAKDKYPWLVKAYENNEYVVGSERIEDTNERAKEAFRLIKEMGIENVIVLTHGNFLKAILPVILNKEVTKKDDAGFILLSVDENKADVILEDGIEVNQ
jgi:2,3-bisphosphoglycerate-dependent phosphoglycerate mutase